MKQIAGIVKTDTQNRKAIYSLLKMDKIPDGTNVLLAFLGHPRFIKMFKEDHPSSKITVLENKDLSWLFSNSPYDVKLVDPVNINLIKEALKDMKFDYVIMNPPYNGNLHLKILDEAIKHSDKVVNLSPIRWLQDPLAKYKNGSDFLKFKNITKRLSKLEVIEQTHATDLFGGQKGAVFNSDLGVYFIDTKGGYNIDLLQKNSIVEKVYQKNILTINSQIESLPYKDYDKNQYYWVGIPFMLGGHTRGIRPESLTSYLIYKGINLETNQDYFKTRRVLPGVYKEDRPFPGIKFSSQIIAKNFISSQKSKFNIYLDITVRKDQHHQVNFMPYMGNEINPRTGLKGYESEWTDEDFYKFFDLSSDEIKVIEETIKKYE